MKILRSILNFYIQSSIHVALAVTSLSVITIMQFGFVPEPSLLIFTLLGTIAGYNFVKYAGISNLHNLEKTRHIIVIRVFSVFSLFGAGYYALLLPGEVLITASIFGGLTFFYALPLYKNRNLRSLPGIKIFIIALVWMGITVLVPFEYHNVGFSLKVFYQCLEIFLFVIALTLPFEIRDLKFDEPQLGTIPQKLGIYKTKWLASGLLLLVGTLTIMQNAVSETYVLISLAIAGLTLISIWFTKERSNYFVSFWIEGIPILWLVLLLFI